jgi:uncharacterized protein (TIGR00299 family) protein
LTTSQRPLLFIDGSAGAAGDMLLAALFDLGVSSAAVRRSLKTLPIEGWTLRVTTVERAGLAARKIRVGVHSAQPPRRGSAIAKILRGGQLSPRVRQRASEIFQRLIAAEAEAHGVPERRAHLHEVGAVDAIVDVVGVCAALELLGVERIVASPLTTGFGSVQCEHGTYPVPAPATLLLLRDIPVQAGPIEAERVTPTGAAILSTLVDEWSSMPLMLPRKVGLGAGDHDLGRTPNVLRMVLGEAVVPRSSTSQTGEPEVVVLECTLDDATPQNLAYATERLLEAGALDVFVTPVIMKKSRPGHQLTCLADAERLQELIRILFEETPTLGLRYRTERRAELDREWKRVTTSYGRVRVKVGRLSGREVQVWPEYDDCVAVARRHSVPLHEVQQAALTAYRRKRR